MQQLIVIVIGVLVFGYVVYQTYKTLTNKSTSSDVKCGGCNSCSPISEK
ncbi:MAG: FeoB-associated Cys-rich membrane protein [Paludibacteraceae bacterium]|nr:FeoB-associated Cys-rich membrane protein [Bacteroidia bacterium]